MRAAPEELEIIAAAVQDLQLPVPQQILLEGSLVEMSLGLGKELGLDWFRDSVFPTRQASPHQFTAALLTGQIELLIRALRANPGVRLMPIEHVTTLSGL